MMWKSDNVNTGLSTPLYDSTKKQFVSIFTNKLIDADGAAGDYLDGFGFYDITTSMFAENAKNTTGTGAHEWAHNMGERHYMEYSNIPNTQEEVQRPSVNLMGYGRSKNNLLKEQIERLRTYIQGYPHS